MNETTDVLGFFEGNTALRPVSYATSRLRDKEQPHLSLQHYELSGKQEVLGSDKSIG